MAREHSRRVQEIDGENYSIFFDPATVREALQVKPRQGDIVLMTYPSSGTHWMIQMIQLILHEGRSARNYEEYSSRYCMLEHFGKKLDEVTSTPRLLATHIRPGKLAVTSEAKYVYMARTPWDNCTSLYEGWGTIPGAEVSSFAEYFSMFLKGETAAGSYFQHLHAGYTRRNLKNFLFVTYEEASQDSKAVFLRLAGFLSPHYVRTLIGNPEILRQVVGQCDANFMRGILNVSKKRMSELLFRNPNRKNVAIKEADEMEESSLQFVRQATTGRWAQAFSKEELRLLLKKIDDTPEAQCVKDIWKEEFLKVSHSAQ